MKIGKTIKNRYKLLDKIGYGGMSTVYLARDIKTGIAVAVKVMDNKLTSGPNYIKRFKRETEIARHLNHPNIPKLIDYGEMEDTKAPHLVMEYVQGISLRRKTRT